MLNKIALLTVLMIAAVGSVLPVHAAEPAHDRQPRKEGCGGSEHYGEYHSGGSDLARPLNTERN